MAWCWIASKTGVASLLVGVSFAVAAWEISVAIEHYRRPYVWVTGGVDTVLQLLVSIVNLIYRHSVSLNNEKILYACYIYLISQMLGNFFYSTSTFLRYMFIEASSLAYIYRTITFPDPVPPTARMALAFFWTAAQTIFLAGFACYHEWLTEKKRLIGESGLSSEDVMTGPTGARSHQSTASKVTGTSTTASNVATPADSSVVGRLFRARR